VKLKFPALNFGQNIDYANRGFSYFYSVLKGKLYKVEIGP